MSHSYICCLIHVVFSTADRRPLIREDVQERLHAYIGGIARKNEMAALAVGGLPTMCTSCSLCLGPSR